MGHSLKQPMKQDFNSCCLHRPLESTIVGLLLAVNLWKEIQINKDYFVEGARYT